MNIGERTVELFPSPKPGAPLVVLNGEAGEGPRVYEATREMSAVGFSLAAVSGLRWEDDLTPWPIPSIAKGRAPFAGQADAYVKQLTERILPKVLGALPAPPGYIALAGYSLAGLFALYALYRTDAFARAVSASGSLWYPGFMEYAQAHAFLRQPDRLYLSLGEKEGQTRNALLQPVERNTRQLAQWYREAGVSTALEFNPGGHFNRPDQRLARGIAWILQG